MGFSMLTMPRASLTIAESSLVAATSGRAGRMASSRSRS